MANFATTMDPRDHIIRVTERPFDDFVQADVKIGKLLGLERN